MRRRALLIVGCVAVAGTAWLAGAGARIEQAFEAVQERRAQAILTRTAFEAWLAESPERAGQFDAFEAFLARQGVSKVVPVWRLAIGDTDRLSICDGAGFVLPPRKSWPEIVPALRLVRDRVLPVVGRVDVRSAYRMGSLNRCAGGASRSRHLSFSAVDLVALDQPDNRSTFSKLCKAWRKAGPSSGWGLGAYFDPSAQSRNRRGRFHVDGTGWRSWGFGNRSASSGCLLSEVKQR